jgi:hypothetical protein
MVVAARAGRTRHTGSLFQQTSIKYAPALESLHNHLQEEFWHLRPRQQRLIGQEYQAMVALTCCCCTSLYVLFLYPRKDDESDLEVMIGKVFSYF